MSRFHWSLYSSRTGSLTAWLMFELNLQAVFTPIFGYEYRTGFWDSGLFDSQT